jgi:hypothetical protein
MNQLEQETKKAVQKILEKTVAYRAPRSMQPSPIISQEMQPPAAAAIPDISLRPGMKLPTQQRVLSPLILRKNL